ncbi:hypothetical protein [Streptomyces sp. NPDC046385]|uniref:hypothetical protein n=1 Tax=Streptomyces sp. NPDC046385 TaxID=3154918 RepID=UPI0033CBA836
MSRRVRAGGLLVGVLLVAGCGGPADDASKADDGRPAAEVCGGFTDAGARALGNGSGAERFVEERGVDLASLSGDPTLWSHPQDVCVIRPVGKAGEVSGPWYFTVERVPKGPDDIGKASGVHTVPLGLGASRSSAGGADIYFRCGEIGIVRAALELAPVPRSDAADAYVTALQDVTHRATVAWGCADDARVPQPVRK